MLDINGCVRTWNPGAKRIKGYEATEIIGKHFSVFYPPDVAVTTKCEDELEIAKHDGRFEEEGWRVRKDGSLFWAHVTITALRDPDRTLVGFAEVTRDLTDRKQAEENVRELAVQRAAVAEKARIQEFQERFLAILGHDLRNPLAAIDMGVAILEQRTSDPSLVRVLHRMVASSGRMNRMIGQILDLTRSRLAGRLELRVATTNLGDILGEIVDELRTAHPTLTIELRCAPSLEGVWDADRLEQVFSNLIGNAVSYGDPSIPVTVVATEVNERVTIEVHNGGAPIPTTSLSTLFDPFRRGERESRSAKTKGLGLGLYISRELAKAHGGTLDVTSDVVHGTTFTVTLPMNSGHARPVSRAVS